MSNYRDFFNPLNGGTVIGTSGTAKYHSVDNSKYISTDFETIHDDINDDPLFTGFTVVFDFSETSPLLNSEMYSDYIVDYLDRDKSLSSSICKSIELKNEALASKPGELLEEEAGPILGVQHHSSLYSSNGLNPYIGLGIGYNAADYLYMVDRRVSARTTDTDADRTLTAAGDISNIQESAKKDQQLKKQEDANNAEIDAKEKENAKIDAQLEKNAQELAANEQDLENEQARLDAKMASRNTDNNGSSVDGISGASPSIPSTNEQSSNPFDKMTQEDKDAYSRLSWNQRRSLQEAAEDEADGLGDSAALNRYDAEQYGRQMQAILDKYK